MSSIAEIKNCENKFCKEYYKSVKKLSEISIKLLVEQFKKKDVKITKEHKLKIKEIKDKIKTKEFKEESMKLCKDSFCNPGCKGTIFQDNKFPQELVNKYIKQKNGKQIIKLLKKFRKDLFGEKKTILKKGFYEKLNVKKLKKKGAISGCASFSIL